MLKTTISKIRKICSVSLIPHILRDEFTLSPNKLGKRTLNGFWKMNKSTDSKDKEAECEKCKRLIEMVFGPEKPDPVLKKVEANLDDIHIDNLQKTIAPSITVKEALNKSDGVTASEVLSVQNKANEPTDTTLSIKKPIEQIGLDILKSTTANENKEELAQKLESIEEPALVEAHPPKTEGFNIPPKVLGDREIISDPDNSLCAKIGPEENALDDIAKKCLGSPPDKIDERIIDEMKNCGMLGRGRRKSSRRHGSYLNRSNRKDKLLETKSDESTLYSEKQSGIVSCQADSTVEHNNRKLTDLSNNIYPQYFKDVPSDVIANRQSEQKTEETEIIIQKDEEKANIHSTHSTTMVDSYQQIPVVAHHTCNTQGEVLEEVNREESNSLQNVTCEEENPESDEKSIEKGHYLDVIHVTAAETSRYGIPGQVEVEADADDTPIKPDILTCNQITRVTETPMIDKSFLADKRESYVTFSNYPSDQFGYDEPDRPFNNPSTAISGTYAPEVKNRKRDTEVKDTAISSRQNPGEYFDLSHIKMEKFDPYAINPLTVRPIEAYHPYTIISGTDDRSHNIFISNNYPFNVAQTQVSQELPIKDSTAKPLLPEVEKPDASEVPNKNISPTMGPLPESKYLDEGLSLTEMLKRVRERNRLQLYQECNYKSVEVQPVEANKCPGDKESKSLGPGPCKPKPKEKCPPKKCPPCPPPCPPPCKKKDPCAKCTKTSLIGYKVKEAFSFVLHVGLKLNSELPIHAHNCNIKAVEPLRPIVEDARKLEKLGSFLLSKYFKRKLRVGYSDIEAEPMNQVYIIDDTNKLERLGNFLLSKCPKDKVESSENEEVILAKDYEPWVPIPSWPIPEEEKKEPFVCPKEGCKIIPPPRLNPPCKENPCINMPKRSFSKIDSDCVPLYIC